MVAAVAAMAAVVVEAVAESKLLVRLSDGWHLWEPKKQLAVVAL